MQLHFFLLQVGDVAQDARKGDGLPGVGIINGEGAVEHGDGHPGMDMAQPNFSLPGFPLADGRQHGTGDLRPILRKMKICNGIGRNVGGVV